MQNQTQNQTNTEKIQKLVDFIEEEIQEFLDGEVEAFQLDTPVHRFSAISTIARGNEWVQIQEYADTALEIMDINQKLTKKGREHQRQGVLKAKRQNDLIKGIIVEKMEVE